MKIRGDSRMAAETGLLTGQPTSKNHNYYTNSNQVIQEPKSHPKKSSFWEKYHKNVNPNISNPKMQK